MNTETANHQATKDQLAIKTAEYDAKVKELAAANIKNLNATLKYV
ncbi:UNVERIFIED_ORG: UV DNA damage repair endonuclease [Peribacillus simplex]